MNFILFDDERYHHFLPLTHTRPVGELRCGILTMSERWRALLLQPLSHHSASHLAEKFPINISNDNVFINSALWKRGNKSVPNSGMVPSRGKLMRLSVPTINIPKDRNPCRIRCPNRKINAVNSLALHLMRT